MTAWILPMVGVFLHFLKFLYRYTLTKVLRVPHLNLNAEFLNIADFMDQYVTRNATPHRLSQYLAVMPQKSAEEVLAESKEMYIQGLSQSCVRFWFKYPFQFYSCFVTNFWAITIITYYYTFTSLSLSWLAESIQWIFKLSTCDVL